MKKTILIAVGLVVAIGAWIGWRQSHVVGRVLSFTPKYGETTRKVIREKLKNGGELVTVIETTTFTPVKQSWRPLIRKEQEDLWRVTNTRTTTAILSPSGGVVSGPSQLAGERPTIHLGRAQYIPITAVLRSKPVRIPPK